MGFCDISGRTFLHFTNKRAEEKDGKAAVFNLFLEKGKGQGKSAKKGSPRGTPKGSPRGAKGQAISPKGKAKGKPASQAVPTMMNETMITVVSC